MVDSDMLTASVMEMDRLDMSLDKRRMPDGLNHWNSPKDFLNNDRLRKTNVSVDRGRSVVNMPRGMVVVSYLVMHIMSMMSMTASSRSRSWFVRISHCYLKTFSSLYNLRFDST